MEEKREIKDDDSTLNFIISKVKEKIEKVNLFVSEWGFFTIMWGYLLSAILYIVYLCVLYVENIKIRYFDDLKNILCLIIIPLLFFFIRGVLLIGMRKTKLNLVWCLVVNAIIYILYFAINNVMANYTELMMESKTYQKVILFVLIGINIVSSLVYDISFKFLEKESYDKYKMEEEKEKRISQNNIGKKEKRYVSDEEKEYKKEMLITWVVSIVLGLLIGFITGSDAKLFISFFCIFAIKMICQKIVDPIVLRKNSYYQSVVENEKAERAYSKMKYEQNERERKRRWAKLSEGVVSQQEKIDEINEKIYDAKCNLNKFRKNSQKRYYYEQRIKNLNEDKKAEGKEKFRLNVGRYIKYNFGLDKKENK